MSKPYPGPYFLSNEDASICTRDAETGEIVKLCMFTEWAGNDHATAQVMIASLDMLAALKRVKIVMDGIIHPAMRRPDDALSEVEAAIAKAEGRS